MQRYVLEISSDEKNIGDFEILLDNEILGNIGNFYYVPKDKVKFVYDSKKGFGFYNDLQKIKGCDIKNNATII